MQNRFYAVIVTYNPNFERLTSTVNNLLKQGFSVVVVDNNSSNILEIEKLKVLCALVYLDNNYGIAKALNVGMAYAINNGADWILSSDQDTIISPNILDEYKRYVELPKVGALCPSVRRKDGYNSASNFEEFEIIERCPTSGFFISAEAWKKCGGYDDWLFIDYVDYDICIKLKIAGYFIYRVNSAFIIQELGNAQVKRFIEKIGKLLNVKKIINFSHTYNHSPLRNYYFVRNALFYQFKYKNYIDLNKDRMFVLKWELKKLLLEPKKLAILESIFHGYKDYKKHVEELNFKN